MKARRLDSSGQRIRKPGSRRSLEAQEHQATDEPRPRIGLDEKRGAITAVGEAQVEKQPLHGQIWWEPICFDPIAARTVASTVFLEAQATGGKQTITHSTRRLQVARHAASPNSTNLERSEQVMATSHGQHLERHQIPSQAKLKRTAAHRKEYHSRATKRQRATDAESPVGLDNACETVGNEDRASVEPSGAVTQLPVRHQRNFQESRHSQTSNTYRRQKRGVIYDPDYQVSHSVLEQRYLSTTKALSRNSRVRKHSERAEQWTAAEQRSDRTEYVPHETELWNVKYLAFRAPFYRVSSGYFDLLNTLWDARKDCPRLGTLWTYVTMEILNMRYEFRIEAHRYRLLAKLANQSGAIYESEGLRRTYSFWRRRVREFYLNSPFKEQRELAVQNMQALFQINNTRRQLGLSIIYGGGRLRDDEKAFYEAGRDFLACVKERDILGRDDIEKKLNKTLGRIKTVIDGLRELLRESRSLVFCWDRLTSSSVPPFALRQNFYCSLQALVGFRWSFVHAASQAEVALEERLLRQLAKSAVGRNPLLSVKTGAPIRGSQHSHQPHQQSLNFHATAALNTMQFGDGGLWKSSPECLFNLVERQASGTPTGDEQCPIQCSFQISEELKKETLAASTSGDIYWQYNLYRGPAGERVKVHYCRNKESSDRIAKLFLDKSVIGFDIEWKAQASAAEGTKKNVSLVQLASEDRIALFHIARFGKDGSIDDLVPPSLKQIMETPDITKVGVAVKADCTRLRKFMGIESRGILELSHLYKLIKFSRCDVKKINKSLVSLAQQVEEHLLLPMWKGEVRSSDWSEELNFQQIRYAASDSYAGLQLYHAMEAKRKAIEPTPPCPAHAELNLPIRLANGQTVATYNEAEEAEDEPSTTEPAANNDVLPEVEQMARDFLNVTIEDVRQGKVKQSAKPNPKRSPKPGAEKAPEITAAETWVAAWRTTRPDTYKAKATPAYLRAYAVWHAQGFDVQETASLLRDPPLQLTTVSNYILEAIRMEKLAYDAKRLKEVLAHLPESVAKTKYQSLRRQLE